MREITMAQAINEALEEEMRNDERVFLLGEDIGLFGGCNGVTRGLYKKFPDRVLDTMIAENGIMGLATGAAYAGLKPVPELMFSDFAGVCFDYFYNQMSKNRYMTGMQEGGRDCCIVTRMPNGAGLRMAAQHSQCAEGLFMNIPGIKIAIPSTPADAKGLMKYCLRGNDPVVFFEHHQLLNVKGPVPEGEYLVPLCSADVKREGSDVTVVALQWMVNKSLEAAKILEKEGISVEVVDPRSLKPLDIKTILKSVKKTGRLVLVDEAPVTGNALTEVGLQVAERAFGDLKAAPLRVCGPDVPIPFSPTLEDEWLVSVDDIVEGIRKVLK